MMLFSMLLPAFASASADIYADNVTAKTGESVIIPVRIKNNNGIMGFRITVNYDSSVLTSPSVNRGSLVGDGMFNDSISDSVNGEFDVVWSGTQNVSGNGIIMSLSFSVLESKNTKIKLNFNQADTFNEAWEDVYLNCSEVDVVFSADEEMSVTEPVSQIKTEPVSAPTNSNPPSHEDIKDAVDIVMGETGRDKIDDIPEKEKDDFVDRTNEILGTLTGKTEKPFESTEEIKQAYEDAVADKFVEDAKEAVDSNEIESAIKDALEFVGESKIEDIPEEKKENFIQKVENNLVQHAPDIDKISDKLTADKAIDAIKNLQEENFEAATEGKKVPVPKIRNTAATVAIIAVSIILAAAIAVVCLRISRKSKGKEPYRYENKD